MKTPEKFEIKKLLSLDPEGFYKVLGLGFKLLVLFGIVLVVLWVKNLMFPAAPENVNMPTINVKEGGKVTYNVAQNQDKRRMEFFGGLYGDKERVGIFGGIKF